MANNNYNREFNVTYKLRADVREFNRNFDDLTRNIKAAYQSAQSITDTFGTMTNQMHQAVGVAAQLRQNLGQAFNTSTGRLDFTQFTKSMRQAGYEMQDYVKALQQLGPAGETAFQQLGNAILNSEIQMKRAHPILDKFITSLGRVALYQFSTKAISMFTSGIRDAFQFTQELNRSLNDIRIVTKMSTDEMASFALKANEAAQALSSTTTAYTDASLIYFQQGLSEEEAIERTNVTLKMANVTGESVKTISNDLTAIWNNFDDGSKNLEYYADVMTKLGAVTASSSKEIATGLEKFAPIAQTVGLSYEYAASALATVSAETRASADIVGTAFKTIFARLESLKLGETLEDGVGLTKYTSAVEAIGVSVMDTNGEMRKLDDILKDIGAKWQELDSAQKSALANTVAGVRQYSQFMALMENWDKVEMNVDVSLGSEGELQKQQDIYAESWQSASKRIKSSLESIYQDLLDDEAFVDMLDNINEIIKALGVMVKTIGGLPGLLSTISNLIFTIKGDVLATSLGKTMESMFLTSRRGIQYQQEQRQIALNAMRQQSQNKLDEFGGGSRDVEKSLLEGPIKATEIQFELQNKLLSQKKQLSDEEKNILKNITDNIKAIEEEGVAYSNLVAEAEGFLKANSTKVKAEYLGVSSREVSRMIGIDSSFAKLDENTQNGNFTGAMRTGMEIYDSLSTNPYSKITENQLNGLKKAYQKAVDKLSNDSTSSEESTQKAVQAFINLLKKYQKKTSESYKKALEKTEQNTGIDTNVQKYKDTKASSSALSQALSLGRSINNGELTGDQINQKVNAMKEAFKAGFEGEGSVVHLTEKAKEALERFFEIVSNGQVNTDKLKELSQVLDSVEIEAKEASNALEKTQGPEAAEKTIQSADAVVEGETHKIHAYQEEKLALQTLNEEGNRLLKGSKKNYEQSAQNMMQFARGVSGLISIVNTMKGAIQTLTDESVSPFEKVITLFTLIPSLTFAVSSAMQLFNISAKAASGSATNLAVSSTAAAVGETAAGAAGTAAASGFYALAGGATAAAGPVGLIVIALTALVGVIALLVTGFENVAKRNKETSLEERLKRINEESEKIKTRFTELVTASEKFADTYKNYAKLQETLKTLTEGSDEYYKVLSDIIAAQEVMIENSPALANLLQNWSDMGWNYEDVYNEDGTINNKAIRYAFKQDSEDRRTLIENSRLARINGQGQMRVHNQSTADYQNYSENQKNNNRINPEISRVFKENDFYLIIRALEKSLSSAELTNLKKIFPDFNEEIYKNQVFDSTQIGQIQEAIRTLKQETDLSTNELVDLYISSQGIFEDSVEGRIQELSSTSLSADDIELLANKIGFNVEQNYGYAALQNSYVDSLNEVTKDIIKNQDNYNEDIEGYLRIMDRDISTKDNLFNFKIDEEADKITYTRSYKNENNEIKTEQREAVLSNYIISTQKFANVLNNSAQSLVEEFNNSAKYLTKASPTMAAKIGSSIQYDEAYNAFLRGGKRVENLTLLQAQTLFGSDYNPNNIYSGSGSDKLTLKERTNTQVLKNRGLKPEELNNFKDSYLKVLSQMYEDGSLYVSDNIEIATKLLKQFVNDEDIILQSSIQEFLKSQQTVSSSIAKSFASVDNEVIRQENMDLLNKFMSGETLDESSYKRFLEKYGLADFAVMELDNNNNIVYKITTDTSALQEAHQYVNNLIVESSKFKDNMSNAEILQAYGTTSTLKETLKLHQQFEKSQQRSATREKEKVIFEQQFNQQLKEGLKTIGSSEAEWYSLKQKFKDVDDLSLYVWLEFKYKGKDLKNAYDKYIESGAIQGSDEENAIIQQISDVFQVDAQTAASLLGSEIGKDILSHLFSDNEDEANKAWQQLQEYFKQNEIQVYINASLNSDFKNKAKTLYDLFQQELSKPENSNLTWDLFIQQQIKDNGLEQFKEGIALTQEAMKKANSELEGLGFKLNPIYEDTPIIGLYDLIEGAGTDSDQKNPIKKTTKRKITGYRIVPLKSNNINYNPFSGIDNNDTSTPTMYESKKQDTGLRFQSLKKEIEDLSDEADDLRKKLNLDISLNLPEDETKYEDILEKRIGLYEQLEQASKNYLESDKENAIKAYNELNNALGGGLADLFDGDKFNKEEFERSYIDLMNSNFAGATKESADAVEQLKEEVDYYTDSWEAAANQQKEATKALKEARQELEKWQRFDKVLDRYNTEQRLFNAQLADEENRMKNINREMQRQEQLASQSTGPQKIAYIDKTIDLLHKQTEELKEQDEISKRSINNIIAELTSLNQSYNLDIDLTNLENHKLILEEEVYEVLKAQFEAMYGQTKSSEEINALVEEYLKKIKEANSLIQKMADNQSTIWGYEAQEQAKNYEKLVEKLNAQLTKTKNELTLISYNFSTLSSNFYTMGEAAALFGQQGEQYIENLEAYKNHLGSLKEAYENTKISQTDYVQGLQQVFDGIMENLNSIEQLDQQVKTYYGQTLQAANAELSAHTAGITRATATLNHYLSVMQMINRQTDYASLGKVYEGLVKTTKNEYDVAVANYEMLKKQEENARQLLEQYSDDKTSKSFEIANQTWQDAAAAMDQAYSDMLSKMEAWTQAIVDNFQNTIHKLQQTLENELTDGTNFDTLITQIERLKTADDEYLTRTNQVYELNKLAREAQKQMDEQVNSVSKQRLGQFINETNALKDRNKFSNLELEIQRARYELLLAEMAVEDARANKNKVRLQRDSEGGYGYVYTAEADDVSDAVQKYEDAQNRLYNIGLENADNYTNKRVQTAKEWFDTMVQIEEDYQNGTIESEEEYRNRQDEATQYYYQRLQNYAELYQIALHETDENVILDSWTTHTTIEGHTEKWKNAMDKYVGEVREEWDKYRRDLTYANEEVGRTAEETEGKVKLLTTASQELTDQILSQGGLISALDTQLGAVLKQVSAYTDWRDSIKGVIEEMKKLAELTAKDINDQNGVGGSPSSSAYEGQDISRLMAANQLRKYELENLGRDLTAEESDEYTALIKEYSTLIAARNEKMKSSEYANELTTEQIDSIIKELLWYEKISTLKELAQTGGKLFDSLKSIIGLDTGGYTGEWSNDGRLAFLHQKELVLNAEDTQNILSAVGMVRQMDSLLEGFTFGQGLTPGTMQQQVTIHAEFPNVQDHNEIELAFNDLVNRASQYIMAR